VAGVGAFVFVISLIFWKIIAATIGIRVSAEEEMEGLDIGEHGNIAYPDFVSSSGRGFAVESGVGNMAGSPAAYRVAQLSKEPL
jgi:Amt family ammonium transporter